jgi:hypothetical protein
MASQGKILGQGVPTTTTSTTLYTVPNNSTQTTIPDVVICNVSANPAGAYLYAVKGGGTAGTTNAVAYGFTVAANSTITLNLSATLSNTAGVVDFLVCGSSVSAALTFTAFGSEIS